MTRDETDEADNSDPPSNEWGIPDWRDPSNYGDTNSWSDIRWRWEFFRRRDDLRAYFDVTLESEVEERKRILAAGGPYLRDLDGRRYKLDPDMLGWNDRADVPGFGVNASEEARQRFGYLAIRNPRIGSQPEGAIIPENDWVTACLLDGSKHDGTYPEFRLPKNQVAFVFDMDAPLETQIERARGALRAIQTKRHGKLVTRRYHRKKLLIYLRALDAREDGASWREIAALNPSKAQTEQAGRDTWNAADTLRFNF